jgi:plasmid stabilization system protein ParE
LRSPPRREPISSHLEIHRRKQEKAHRVFERLFAALSRLAQTPGMGHHRKDLTDERHRFWTVYSYVIAYRHQTRPLETIAIVHGARQLEAFFQGRISGQASEATE